MLGIFKKLTDTLFEAAGGRRVPKTWPQVSDELAGHLPRYCHTIGGVAHDPMNLVLVGTKKQIDSAFRAAGWQDCDPPTPWNLLRSLLAGLLGWRYVTGPITPMMADGELQDLAYQKSTAKHPNPKKRHHIRIWQSAFTLKDGRPVWVAAASYDQGFKLTYRPLFITHRIDPDIDTERDFIVAQLRQQGGKAGRPVSISTQIAGRNAFGDHYTTDGRAAVIEL